VICRTASRTPASSSGVSTRPSAAKPLAHLGDSRARISGRGREPEIERVRQPQPLELQDVAESLGDEKTQARARPLDQRVHRDRRAVDDSADLAQIDAVLVGQTREPDANGLGELVRR